MVDVTESIIEALTIEFPEVYVYDSVGLTPELTVFEQYPSIKVNSGAPVVRVNSENAISGHRSTTQEWYLTVQTRSPATMRRLYSEVIDFLNPRWLGDVMVRPLMSLGYAQADMVISDPARRIWRATMILQRN